MAALLERLHREHVERQRKWFAPPPPAPEPAVSAPAAAADPEPADLALHRLVRRAAAIEAQLAAPAGATAELPRPRTRTIQKIVARFYRVSLNEIISPRRDKHLCWARHVAFYLASQLTRHSLPKLGRAFGGRDHTTVLHGIRRIKARRESDERLRDELELLLATICEETGYAAEEAEP